MNCSNCGQHNGEGVSFCMHCGKLLAVPPAATPTTASATSSTSNGSPLYAGFWRRVSAYTLDSLILFIAAIALAVILEDHELLLTLALLVVIWLYRAGMASSAMQATLGKKAMSIKVAGLSGERISFARSSGRFISEVLFGGFFFMAGFTKKRQAVHDMMASTLVVSSRATPDQIREGSGTMPMTRRVWVMVVVTLVIFIGGNIFIAMTD